MKSIDPYSYDMLSAKEQKAYISRCKWEYELFRPKNQKNKNNENYRTD